MTQRSDPGAKVIELTGISKKGKVMSNQNIITGHAAIEYAEQNGVNIINKYACPIEGAREVTLSEAREIAREDPGLIWVGVPSPSSIASKKHGGIF